MSFFLATLGLGLAGLLLMALPGVRRHGHVGHTRTHARGHSRVRGQARGQGHGTAAAHATAPAHAPGTHAPAPAQHTRGPGFADGLLRHIPEPYAFFSVLALFGAFGNVLQRTLRLPFWMSALGAAVIAGGLEWLVVGRLWRLSLKFTGTPASPLTSLVMDQAEAVSVFRNGKGIVRAVLDGRAVQLRAELIAEEKTLAVRVGDRVTIQEVDPDRERVRVSLR
jgi:hypothetical protein